MEGLQAARSADFSIAQFRFLRKLLLVHGAWGYSRLSKLVLYSFYKNISLYLIQLWFAFDNGFSGQTIFESWVQSSYNVLFALMQPVALGLFDQFVSARMLDRYPQLYRLGQRSEFYNNRTFVAWIGNSFFHSFLCYFLMKWMTGDSVILSTGRTSNIWLIGAILYSINIVLITMKAVITIDSWVWFTRWAVFGSIGLWMLLFPTFASIAPRIPFAEELNGVVSKIFISIL
jgi:phospholipid-transporting ATPase